MLMSIAASCALITFLVSFALAPKKRVATVAPSTGQPDVTVLRLARPYPNPCLRPTSLELHKLLPLACKTEPNQQAEASYLSKVRTTSKLN